ncbi:MAG: MFS transporter, partial [Acidobacteria bacterium]|nr:MFS transporter [Acidobacteriota bacterium]
METGRLNGTSTGPEPLTATKPAGLIHRTFQAFRYRDFRLLWSGAFTSTTGTWMQQVAQSWLVLDITGSAFYLGLVSFLADLPILLFSLVGGVVADRVDRRKLLL